MINDLGPVAGNQVTVRPPRSNAAGATRTWHKPCSGPGILDGTTADADMFNDWLAQYRTTFDSSGIAIDGADDMLWRAIQSAGARYATDTGSANNIIVACSPPILSLRVGQVVNVKVAAANTRTINGGAVTIAVDAQAPKAVVFAGGSPLIEGALEANRTERLIYDGVSFRLDTRKQRAFLGAAPNVNHIANGQTIISPSAPSINSMITSSFSNGVFTCGAGEAGWWMLRLDVAEFPNFPIIDGYDISAVIYGPNLDSVTGSAQFSGNQSNRTTTILIDHFNVGDQAQFMCYRLGTAGYVNTNFGGARLGA